MFTMLCRHVAYNIYGSMSQVKVTLRGERSKMCNLCLVRAITCVFMILCKYVHYNMQVWCVQDPLLMSKVKATLIGQRRFLPCQWYINSQIIVIYSLYLVNIITLIISPPLKGEIYCFRAVRRLSSVGRRPSQKFVPATPPSFFIRF